MKTKRSNAERQNVTLSLPKPLLKRVKVLAAEEEEPVSQLMKEVLADRVHRRGAYERSKTYVLCARKAKEAGWDNGLVVVNLPENQIVLDGGGIDRALEGVTSQLFEAYRRCWASAYEKEKSEGRWKEFRIFLLGGSMRLEGIRRALIRRPWDRIEKVLPQSLGIPADFSCPDGSEPQILQPHSSLFSVVYGVSHHRAQYPQFYNPKDVEVLDIPTGRRPVLTWEEPLNKD